MLLAAVVVCLSSLQRQQLTDCCCLLPCARHSDTQRRRGKEDDYKHKRPHRSHAAHAPLLRAHRLLHCSACSRSFMVQQTDKLEDHTYVEGTGKPTAFARGSASLTPFPQRLPNSNETPACTKHLQESKRQNSIYESGPTDKQKYMPVLFFGFVSHKSQPYTHAADQNLASPTSALHSTGQSALHKQLLAFIKSLAAPNHGLLFLPPSHLLQIFHLAR